MESENINTAIINGTNGGHHVVDGPLTTPAAREASPELLVSDVDSRVVRIRPMATPVDQISRMVGARSASSMIVEYYSVDTRPGASTLSAAPETAPEGSTPEGQQMFVIHTADDRLFAPSETLILPEISVGKSDGSKESVIFYVNERITGTTGGLKVTALNISMTDEIPSIEAGAKIVRMGRAAAELDVQTAQFEALPEKARNYCQIFKTQVEQSTFMRLSAKEVGWTFSDQEEVAIMDMRLGMEKSFLFGSMARLTDPVKHDEVLFTRGIWNQAGAEYDLNLSNLSEKELIEMMKVAFTGNAAGSTRKILVAGSELILAINKLDAQRTILAGDTVTRWGIDFNEIRSKFGTLYVIHSEVFDQCGHGMDGMIIDPQYMTKYTHLPFRVDHLDLKKSGVRNTDALVATEASCLVLRHPKSHMRIIGSWDIE